MWANSVIRSTASASMREQAIAAHASQVSPYVGLPEDLRLAFLTADRLQRVSPPWPGGARETDIFAPAAE
jgi:N-acetyl-1-D-myo-inositol-2-amino-2-deoxy-alpha-D-glucopyranoside deacetylase